MKRLRHLVKVYPVGIVVAVIAALGATVFALGATGQRPAVADGASWLWSRQIGEAGQVNAVSGGVSLRQTMIDAQGHPVRVTQSDRYVLLHDLFTGRVTSIDLTRMGFSGSLDLGVVDDTAVFLDGATAIVVDRGRGLVRPVDPATLQAIGDQMRLPAPLVGGGFDKEGRLWMSVPSQGTAIALAVRDRTLSVERTEAVSKPGASHALTVLDRGALVVDRSGTEVAIVDAAGVRRVNAGTSLVSAVVPARTVGTAAAITLPAEGKVVAIADTAKGAPVTVVPLTAAESASAAAQPAVSFAGRIYVTDRTAGKVRVVTASGAPAGTITVGEPEKPMELEVREEHLFINSPDSTKAVMVAEDGTTSTVEKYEPQPQTTPSPTLQPAPSASAEPAPSGKPSARPSPQGPRSSPSPTVRVQPQKPGPPVPVTAYAGDGQVRLTWGRAKAGSAPVQQYTITWEEGGGGRVEVAGDTLQTTIRGLVNGTSYRFRVFATNAVGAGPPALSAPVTPAGAPPPATPDAPQAALETENGTNTGAVTVTWNTVAGAADYVVTPLQSGAAGTHPPRTETGTTARFAGLTPGESFTFTVVARNAEQAASAPSAASNAVTVHYPPSAPTGVSGRQTGPDTYVVSWGAADGHGLPITGYQLCAPDGTVLARVGPGARSVTVTTTLNLTQVRVGAINSDGEGPAGVGPVSAVAAPRVAISGTSATASSVTVRFSVDADGANVTCVVTVGSRTANSCASPVTISGLAAGTAYAVRVQATTFAGTGQDTASQRTDTAGFGATVTCTDAPTNPDPNFCATGLPVYGAGNDDGAVQRRVANGSDLQVLCKVHGENQDAGPYNNEKEGDHWLQLPGGGWISWVWLRFDNGDDVEALPDC